MRIALSLFAASLIVTVPALANEPMAAARASVSIPPRPAKSGAMTVNGQTFPIFRLSGGELVASVVAAKDGQPMHLGPTRYAPLRIGIDAAGLKTLKPAVDAVLKGQSAPFDAIILYNGRRLTISNATLARLTLPSCSQNKSRSDTISLELHIGKVTSVTEAEPAQVTPAKLTTCAATMDGVPAASIKAVTIGPSFWLSPETTEVGDLREYEEEIEPARGNDISLTENGDAPGLTKWARDYMIKGLTATTGMKITYGSETGPAFTLSYGNVLPKRVNLDMNTPGYVTVAAETPVITQP